MLVKHTAVGGQLNKTMGSLTVYRLFCFVRELTSILSKGSYSILNKRSYSILSKLNYSILSKRSYSILNKRSNSILSKRSNSILSKLSYSIPNTISPAQTITARALLYVQFITPYCTFRSFFWPSPGRKNSSAKTKNCCSGDPPFTISLLKYINYYTQKTSNKIIKCNIYKNPYIIQFCTNIQIIVQWS
jgi:hypothetical protein